MSLRRSTDPSLVALGAALFCLSGCYDVEKNFDDFTARDKRTSAKSDLDASFDAAGCNRTLDNTQDFLLTITPALFPTKPNLMKATIKIVENDSMVLTVQSFHYNRVDLVGGVTVTDPIKLNPDGSFETDTLTLDTPGEANCALPDTPVTVEVKLAGGQVCDNTTFACGIMNGKVLAPAVDLNGSTFTAKKIIDGVIPQPETNCEHFTAIEPCKAQ